MDYLRAFMQTESAGEPGQAIRFVAATEGVKRDGMALRTDRWLLDNYRRNPVVLWAHDYSGRTLPIGRADVTPDMQTLALMADITFDQADEFARQVEAKYRGGYLHAVSVGWNNIKQGSETWHELLDISGVPVPGDPDALMERQRRALHDLLSEIEPTSNGESDWTQTAGAMLRLFAPDGDDLDDVRERAYNALLPAYRRNGQTPPEFLSRAHLAAMTTAQLRRLFLCGECDVAPEWAPISRNERVGAMLSAANRRDLEQALSLVQGVLDRAVPAPDTTEQNNDIAAMLASVQMLAAVTETTTRVRL